MAHESRYLHRQVLAGDFRDVSRPVGTIVLVECGLDSRTPKSKKRTLLAALFAIAYDHLAQKPTDSFVVSRVVSALRQRRRVIAQLGTGHIIDPCATNVLPATHGRSGKTGNSRAILCLTLGA
jgi:hypothetical protein